MGKLPTTLSCTGCGRVLSPDERRPFQCPDRREGDDIDHVLREAVDPGCPGLIDALGSFEPNPFVKYRRFFHAYHAAVAWGLSDADFVGIVKELNDAVNRVDGRGFVQTPFESAPNLAQALGLGPENLLWVKDETGNVSGSHKARHLMGIMIWLKPSTS